jgi:cell division protein FtsQ
MRFLTRGRKPAGKAAKCAPAKTRRRARQSAASRSGDGRLRALAKPAALGAAALALIGTGVWAWQADVPTRTAAAVEAAFLSASAEAGLAVREVYVVGREETDRADILSALDVAVGDPTLGFDPHAARERLLALGWVKSAEVRRRLPGIVIADIREREAIAIWQRNGRQVLIDPDGVVIGEKDVHRHRHLKVVTGESAPEHAMDLVTLLKSEPELDAHVVGAVRMGDRRWKLNLTNGIEIQLPESDAAVESAWRWLAEHQRDHEILSRAIRSLDLRHPDRVVPRLTEEGLQELLSRGETEEL